jgi:hypothetical protein
MSSLNGNTLNEASLLNTIQGVILFILKIV